jgi:REP element-mobilizing transposase RayT
MSRPRQVFVEGGVYHLSNKIARNEAVLSENDEATKFVSPLREVKEPDNLTVFAWVLMSNHYHLAVERYRIRVMDVASVFNESAEAASRMVSRGTGKLLMNTEFREELEAMDRHLARAAKSESDDIISGRLAPFLHAEVSRCDRILNPRQRWGRDTYVWAGRHTGV